MPHVHALFPEDEVVRDLLQREKKNIVRIVAQSLGYRIGEVALIPHPVSPGDMELAWGLLPLELVIDAGSRVKNCEADALKIRDRILFKCPDARNIDFGVWVRRFEGHFVAGYRAR